MVFRNTAWLAAVIMVLSFAVHARTPGLDMADGITQVTGKVVGETQEGFRVDHGEGIVEVEVNNWTTYRDLYGMLDGDMIMVRGTMNKEPDGTQALAAETIHIDDFKTYFFISTADSARVDYSKID